MYHKIARLLMIAVLLMVMGSIAAVVSAEDKYEEEGPFSLEAEAEGDEDTLTFVIEAEDGDKLEIKLDIDTSEGEWELVLEDPEGNEVGVMTDDDVDNADDVDTGENSDNDEDNDDDFKYESEGAVEAGEYVFTFTNTGADPASISGEYSVEVKDDDRYFFDPGARVVIYIHIDIISLWGINDDGEGYEAIVIRIDDIKEKIKKHKHSKGDYEFVFVDWDELELEENLLLAESEDGMVRLYILTTGEFQVMVGPFEDGTVQVFVYDSFPPTSVYRLDYNVYTVLDGLEALGEDD